MSLEQVPEPKPAAGEALLRVIAAGICGSELSGYLGHNSLRVPPLIMGHEFSAEVIEANGATDLRQGQAVTVNPLLADGTCPHCRQGRDNLCLERTLVGVNRPGGFADWVTAPLSALHGLPAGLETSTGALIEPLACGLRAVQQAQAGPTTSLFIAGAGTMGLMSLLAARQAGVRTIVVSDTNDERLRVARGCGASVIVNPASTDIQPALAEIGDGAGLDSAIDAVGLPQTRQQAVQAVRRGGRVVFLGLHQDGTELPGNYIVRSETEVVGSFSYTRENFGAAVRLLGEGIIGRQPAWLEERPLDAGPASFDELIDRPSAVSKILLRP